VLTDAGFLAGKKLKQWVFYKREERAIVAFKTMIKIEV